MIKKKAKKTRKIRKKKLRRFTPLEQQNIRDLADLLGNFLPATSRGDYCLQKIATKIRLGKYFDLKLGNKKKQFNYFIQQVYGRHKVKFKTLVNNILAEAVEWRRNQGRPILRQEVDSLKGKLYALGIDLRKEIDALNLPVDRPKITPPPVPVKQTLEKIGLHPLLLDKAFPLFRDGYLNESVRKSGEILETFIIRSSGIKGKYGRDLAANAFNASNPVINISGYHNSDTLNPTDEKEGFMYLCMGAMHWCKNIMGHNDVDQLSPADAASRIIMISHLLEVAESQFNKATSE